MLTWPGLWFVRASVVAIRAWRHSPPEQVLIIGTGPLGRVTGEDIRDTSKTRQVAGYLSWKDEAKQRRLPAPVMGRWDDLESSLKQSAIAEVYIAGNPAKNGEAMQARHPYLRALRRPVRTSGVRVPPEPRAPRQWPRFSRRLRALPQRRAQAGADGLQAAVRHRRLGVRAVGALARYCW